MEIEVEWKVKPASGLTTIDLKDLGCKSEKEWKTLSKEQQKERINTYLMESDQSLLIPDAIDW